MLVLKGKNWRRMLASAYWPPAHPIAPTHNSHPQVTLGSLDCSFLSMFMPSFQGFPDPTGAPRNGGQFLQKAFPTPSSQNLSLSPQLSLSLGTLLSLCLVF